MTDRIYVGGLQVDAGLYEFVNNELLPTIDREAEAFWIGFRRLVDEIAPRNRDLLGVREKLQEEIDTWHQAHPGVPVDAAEYIAFLREIGYLLPEPEDFGIETRNVDPEVATTAGPQLVVPVLNARFVLNAVNARWGSLYDALYGSDVIDEGDSATRDGFYDPVRGARVIQYVRSFLDHAVPLAAGQHADAVRYVIAEKALVASFPDGSTSGLVDPSKLRGYRGSFERPSGLLLIDNGLHIEIQFDPNSAIGASDRAGVSDVVVEAALTTIVDFEDSIAAVDADDKVEAYRNWLALNRGDLTAEFTKGHRPIVRRLSGDHRYTNLDGTDLTLPGRSLLFVRNVGHLMTTDAVLDEQGREIGEGILDALITSAAALPGLDPKNPYRSSRTGSVYIVKPKMHSPDEVDLTVRLFALVEDLLGIPRNTLKLGLMDEERRLSVNLKAAIHAARERIVFINTGFLDRSGDEIHTCMHAGPVVRKADMKVQPWILAYEDQNVFLGLATGLSGRGQIGKGMWTMPDLMADMLHQKISHPRSGATTAWVPSPTAATLHALHYHHIDVFARQEELRGKRRTTVDDLLAIPLGDPAAWSDTDRQQEVDNNVQSILGYVVRWIHQGIGCSKVPNVHNVALMEDRATLRISSQLLANWLEHGIVTDAEVRASLRRMSRIVDEQNADDSTYRPMAANYDTNIAVLAAQDLIFEGVRQPNGYTEPILHRRRREHKASLSTLSD
jgi:malate synthase